ncbi:MAG TPA: tetratricopeptide repeat protein, partial [Kofleriaceae bacterium]|nr:tetratricopeptide repeat protein [Kofleriaceae bacterium]
GRSAGALAAEWRAMIDSIQLPSGDPEKVRERFRRGGIFQRPCPHAIADKRGRAARLVGRGRVAEALELLRSICDDAPDEPTYRIDLAELLVRGERPAEAISIYRALADDAEAVSTSLRADAHVALAGLAMRAGDKAGVKRALDDAAALQVDDEQARQIAAQRFAAAHAGPAGDALRAYFWPPDATIGVDPLAQLGRAAAAVAAEPSLGLGHYLVGRNLSDRGAFAESARALAHALELGLPSPLLSRECASLLAAEAYRAGDLAAVERAAAILTAADQPVVTQLYGYDFLERVHWKRTGRVTDAPLGPLATPPG